MWSCDQSLIKKVGKCWGVNSYVCKCYRGNTGSSGGSSFLPLPLPIQNSVNLKLKAQKKHIHLHNMKTQKYDFEFTVT